MNEDFAMPEVNLSATSTDLETILAAWHAATVRLEQTHETLRAEVARLTDELEARIVNWPAEPLGRLGTDGLAYCP